MQRFSSVRRRKFYRVKNISFAIQRLSSVRRRKFSRFKNISSAMERLSSVRRRKFSRVKNISSAIQRLLSVRRNKFYLVKKVSSAIQSLSSVIRKKFSRSKEFLNAIYSFVKLPMHYPRRKPPGRATPAAPASLLLPALFRQAILGKSGCRGQPQANCLQQHCYPICQFISKEFSFKKDIVNGCTKAFFNWRINMILRC
jgi:hypothetical protein